MDDIQDQRRIGDGVCLSVCAHVEEKVPEGFENMTVNGRGSEEDEAKTRNINNLLRKKKKKKNSLNCQREEEIAL